MPGRKRRLSVAQEANFNVLIVLGLQDTFLKLAADDALEKLSKKFRLINHIATLDK